jgi:cell division protein FtsB
MRKPNQRGNIRHLQQIAACGKIPLKALFSVERKRLNMPEPGKQKDHKIWRYGLLVVMLVVLAMLVSEFNNRTVDLKRLSSEEVRVEQRLEGQIQTRVALETETAFASSDRAAEAWARRFGKMKKPGDVVVVVVAPATETPVPSMTTKVDLQEKDNLRRWQDLLFGIKDSKP